MTGSAIVADLTRARLRGSALRVALCDCSLDVLDAHDRAELVALVGEPVNRRAVLELVAGLTPSRGLIAEAVRP